MYNKDVIKHRYCYIYGELEIAATWTNCFVNSSVAFHIKKMRFFLGINNLWFFVFMWRVVRIYSSILHNMKKIAHF
jgi:hypothetical protein